jgi:hypothetical protein
MKYPTVVNIHAIFRITCFSRGLSVLVHMELEMFIKVIPQIRLRVTSLRSSP